MKNPNKAFTLVELLVVISIIALLLGLVIPATNHVMKAGRVAAMKATIHSVSVGVEQFKTDKGSYPVSNIRGGTGNPHSIQIIPESTSYITVIDNSFIDVGAHHLAEAMFGLDKLGYSPEQLIEAGSSAEDRFYSIDPLSGKPLGYNTIIDRADIYVDPSKLEIGNMKDAFQNGIFSAPQKQEVWNNPNPVILDKTNRKSPTPLLYFKANKRANILTGNTAFVNNNNIPVIYNFDDNIDILSPYGMYCNNPGSYDYLSTNASSSWPQYIWDTKTGIGTNEMQRLNSPAARPYNPDTFLLISGGPDGRFGTEDDITNFERRE